MAINGYRIIAKFNYWQSRETIAKLVELGFRSSFFDEFLFRDVPAEEINDVSQKWQEAGYENPRYTATLFREVTTFQRVSELICGIDRNCGLIKLSIVPALLYPNLRRVT